MDKKRIIKNLKRQEDEKVPTSLKLPKGLKNDLEKITEKNNISMNGLITNVLFSFVDDESGLKIKTLEKFAHNLYERTNRDIDSILEHGIDADNQEFYKYSLALKKELEVALDI